MALSPIATGFMYLGANTCTSQILYRAQATFACMCTTATIFLSRCSALGTPSLFLLMIVACTFTCNPAPSMHRQDRLWRFQVHHASARLLTVTICMQLSRTRQSKPANKQGLAEKRKKSAPLAQDKSSKALPKKNSKKVRRCCLARKLSVVMFLRH